MEKEVWKDIPSLPGVKASSHGRILAPECTALMPRGNERTYKTKPISGVRRKANKEAKHVYFGWLYRGKNYKVHRLICEAFHGVPSKESAIVIHLDENGLNNRSDNLRWGTQKENLNMPKFIEYCKGRTGENSPAIKGKKASGGSIDKSA